MPASQGLVPVSARFTQVGYIFILRHHGYVHYLPRSLCVFALCVLVGVLLDMKRRRTFLESRYLKGGSGTTPASAAGPATLAPAASSARSADAKLVSPKGSTGSFQASLSAAPAGSSSPRLSFESFGAWRRTTALAQAVTDWRHSTGAIGDNSDSGASSGRMSLSARPSLWVFLGMSAPTLSDPPKSGKAD